MRLSRFELLLVFIVFGQGLCGIHWGLPSRERLDLALPPGKSSDTAFHDRLAKHRERLYENLERTNRISTDLVTRTFRVPASSEPAEALFNSYRSFFLRSANPDEQKNLTYLGHMKPRQLRFEPFGVGYGGAFIYPLGAYYAVLAVLRIVRATSDVSVYMADPARMARIFVAGRIFNLVWLAVCAVLLARLMRRLNPWPEAETVWAVLAGLLFATSPALALVSHTLNPYGLATAWSLLGAVALVDFADSGRRFDLVRAAAFIGLSVGSTPAYWTLGLLALTPLVVAPRTPWPERMAQAALAAAVCGMAFVLSNPYLFLRWDRYVDELVYLMLNTPPRPRLGAVWAFVHEFLAPNLGVALTAVMLGSIGLWIVRGRPLERVFGLVFSAAFLDLGFRLSDFGHVRHFLPYLALGCMASSMALARLAAWKGRRLAGAFVVVILFEAATVSGALVWNFRLDAKNMGTRTAAGAWINAHVPAGASVGLLAPPQPSDTPPFRYDRYELVILADTPHLAREKLPDYLVLSEARGSPAVRILEPAYELLARFDPPALPWVQLGQTLSNVRMEVYRRKLIGSRG